MLCFLIIKSATFLFILLRFYLNVKEVCKFNDK